MTSVHDLLNLLVAPKPVVHVEQQFYAKYDPNTMRILKVFSGHRPEETDVIEINAEVGKKLVSGIERSSKWIVGFKDDIPELQKLSDIKDFHRNRVDLTAIMKLDFKTLDDFYDAQEAAAKRKALIRKQQAAKKARLESLIRKTQSPSFMPKDYWHDVSQAKHVKDALDYGDTDVMFDVILKVDRESDVVEITYHGDTVQRYGKLLRFFFTREDDPSHLKCVINLDPLNLDRITKANGLTSWPNPMRVKIPYGADDLSIYTIKSNLEILVMETK